MKLKFQKFMDILYVLSIISIIENVVINKDLSLYKMERRVTIDRCIIEAAHENERDKGFNACHGGGVSG